MTRTYPLALALTFLIALIPISSLHAIEPSRIDASSDATTEASYGRMTRELSPQGQQELAIAVLKINLAGVMSATEVTANPNLQHPSVTRIKDKIAGMSADEIIDLANRVSTVTVKVGVRQ